MKGVKQTKPSVFVMKNKIRNQLLAGICAAGFLCTPSAEALYMPQNDFQTCYMQSLPALQVDSDAITMLSRQVAEIIQSENDEAEIDTSAKSDKLTLDEIKSLTISELEDEIELQQDIMDNAHEMAESARLLGLSDESNTIQTSNTFYTEAQNSLSALKSELDTRKEDTPPIFSLDVYTKSNLSVENYECILEGTPLAGHGQDFYDMEQEWGVNGLFALSVAQGESSMGANGNLATKKNNFFGIQNHSFSSAREGILFFGELLNDPLYKDKDLETVARSYCPPTWKDWAAQKRIIMRTYWKKISESSQQIST